MASVTPRKNELDLVVSLMESEEFEDAKGAARAVIKGLYDEWRRREWYVAAHRFSTNDPVVILYGMEPTRNAAEKFATSLGTGIASVVKVYPVGGVEDRLDAMHREEWERRAHPCVDCGHGREHHGAKGHKGQPIRVPAGKACTLNCKCKAYRAPEYEEEEASGESPSAMS